MDPILNRTLPVCPWTDPVARRLPGTRAADPGDWIVVDEVFAAQMSLRDHLLGERPGDVVALLDPGREAAGELLDVALDTLSTRTGFAVSADAVTRPDGRTVPIRREMPLETLGRLVQEDLCILTEGSDEHVLSGAVLCFPGGWTLSEKLGRPLTRLHAPVPDYGASANRVQRLFDGLKPGRPIWRANAHRYDYPDLHAPAREADARTGSGRGAFVRSEFQVLFRLPRTGAVAFSIHTRVVRVSDMQPDQRAALYTADLPPGH